MSTLKRGAKVWKGRVVKVSQNMTLTHFNDSGAVLHERCIGYTENFLSCLRALTYFLHREYRILRARGIISRPFYFIRVLVPIMFYQA